MLAALLAPDPHWSHPSLCQSCAVLPSRYVTDYCVWLQTVKTQAIEALSSRLETVNIGKDDLDWPLMAIEEIVDAPDDPDPVDEPKIYEVDSSASGSDSDGSSDSDDQTDSDDQDDDDADADADGGNGAEPAAAAALGEDGDGGGGGVGGLITVLSETTIATGADETTIVAYPSGEGAT